MQSYSGQPEMADSNTTQNTNMKALPDQISVVQNTVSRMQLFDAWKLVGVIIHSNHDFMYL